MQTADFDYNDFASNQQSEADKKLLVKFYTKTVPDNDASAAEGRPMFKDKEYVDIRVPGARDGVGRPATPRDKQRFPQHYLAYKNRMEAPLEGTPLSEYPAISRSLADQLSFQNIKTVEQLADLNDSLMHTIPGAQNFKQKAKDWLESTKDDGVLSRMRDELSQRDLKIQEQGDQLAGLLKRLDAMEQAEAT